MRKAPIELKNHRGPRINKRFATIAAIGIALTVAASSPAQVGPGGLVFLGDRVVKEPIASTAPIVQICEGRSHTVAVRADGTLVAWGADQLGQCDLPKNLTGAKQAAAGYGHTVVLLRNGTVKAFGWNNYGQATPPAGLTNVVQVAAGDYFSVALKSDGTVVAWGDNQSALNNAMATATNVVQIAAGYGHVVGLLSNGAVQCWGTNGHGECTVPAGMGSAIGVSAAYQHTGAVLANGTVRCWGDNSWGSATPPSNLTGVVQLAMGPTHGLAVKSDGSVVGWGSNPYGETTIPTTAVNMKFVAAGSSTSYAIDGKGQVVGWGESTWGQTFVPSNLYGARKITAGANHLLILRNDGSLGAWGRNMERQSETPVLPGTVFTDISAGYYHNAATGATPIFNGLFGKNSDGQVPGGTGSGFDHLWAFGYDTYMHKTSGGMSGFGDDYFGERDLDATQNYVQITGAFSHALGLLPSGLLRSAGSNNYNLQVIPAAAQNIVQIASGESHDMALKNDGTVISWGLDNYGQATVPASVTNVVQVAAGTEHSVVLKSNGTVFAWGGNTYGQTTISAGLTEIAQIAAGQFFTVCLPKMTMKVGQYGSLGGDDQVGTIYLTSPAPAGGVSVSLTSDNSAIAPPAVVTVPAGSTSANFVVHTANVTVETQAVVTALLATGSQSALVTALPAPFSMSLTVSSLVGGSTTKSTGTVTLSSPAPVGGAHVLLTSSDPSVVVPVEAKVPAGQLTKTFTITHARVGAPTDVTIQGTYVGLTRNLPISILPFQVTKVTLSPTIVLGSTASLATVTLNATPVGSVDVALTSSDTSAVPDPGTLTITGASKGVISVPTNAISTVTTVNITGAVDGSSVNASLKVQPTLSALTIDTATLYGNGQIDATITLGMAAPVGGFQVQIAGTNCTAPAVVTVPEGSKTTTFSVVADDVVAGNQMTLTASVGAVQIVKAKAITANTVATLIVDPSTFIGSTTSSVTATITLKGAVAVDTVVTLASSDAAHASLPATVTILAGQSSATVPVTHTSVAKVTKVVLSATHAGATKNATITLNP